MKGRKGEKTKRENEKEKRKKKKPLIGDPKGEIGK